MAMKNKYIKILLGISVFIITFLFLYIMWPQNWCGKVHLQDVVCKSQDMVPDEKTAEKIADAIIESHGGLKDLRAGFSWSAEVDYNEKNNMWIVCYIQKREGGGWLLDKGREVWIDRESGMITLIWER